MGFDIGFKGSFDERRFEFQVSGFKFQVSGQSDGASFQQLIGIDLPET
jgi:hypothetical protein